MNYQEESSSQLPTLPHSHGLAISIPSQALQQQGGNNHEVLLTGILETWLSQHNQIQHQGQTTPFNPRNIREAVKKL